MWPTHADFLRPEGRETSRLRQESGGVGYLFGITYQAQSDHVPSGHEDPSVSSTSGFALQKEMV